MFNLFGSKSDWPIEKAKESISKGEGHFVDVREEFEVESGHAKDAIWISLGKLANNPHDVLENLKATYGADKEYYVYCRSGNRSGHAEMIMKGHGLNAHNVGGFMDLVREEVPSETGIPTKVL